MSERYEAAKEKCEEMVDAMLPDGFECQVFDPPRTASVDLSSMLVLNVQEPSQVVLRILDVRWDPNPQHAAMYVPVAKIESGEFLPIAKHLLELVNSVNN